jgi:hypothetical protein
MPPRPSSFVSSYRPAITSPRELTGRELALRTFIVRRAQCAAIAKLLDEPRSSAAIVAFAAVGVNAEARAATPARFKAGAADNTYPYSSALRSACRSGALARPHSRVR